MNGTKRNGPCAKGTALRNNTVLGKWERHAQLASGRKEARALFNRERAGRKEIQDDTFVDNNDSQNQLRTHPKQPQFNGKKKEKERIVIEEGYNR
jgi:hypothetical protein